ncbi:hypothetical protein BDN70DRAFT_709834 [Pholiota conissans]|uniref:Uncharacterized protein n=1 Tax=Pholiota conissans TaxID=109636 RepID=A0A9P6D0Y9_9AGAR|nr:hypothetical protein BDN70DRAFT_709834 [Pholiota conissans]
MAGFTTEYTKLERMPLLSKKPPLPPVRPSAKGKGRAVYDQNSPDEALRHGQLSTEHASKTASTVTVLSQSILNASRATLGATSKNNETTEDARMADPSPLDAKDNTASGNGIATVKSRRSERGLGDVQARLAVMEAELAKERKRRHLAEETIVAERKRRQTAEDAIEEERTKRRAAEVAIADIRRECRAPFVVPSLVDAFMELSRLTTIATAPVETEFAPSGSIVRAGPPPPRKEDSNESAPAARQSKVIKAPTKSTTLFIHSRSSSSASEASTQGSQSSSISSGEASTDSECLSLDDGMVDSKPQSLGFDQSGSHLVRQKEEYLPRTSSIPSKVDDFHTRRTSRGML